jgi:hypothetical protein
MSISVNKICIFNFDFDVFQTKKPNPHYSKLSGEKAGIMWLMTNLRVENTEIKLKTHGVFTEYQNYFSGNFRLE